MDFKGLAMSAMCAKTGVGDAQFSGPAISLLNKICDSFHFSENSFRIKF